MFIKNKNKYTHNIQIKPALFSATIGIFSRSIQEIELTNIKIIHYIDWFLLKQLHIFIFLSRVGGSLFLSLCFVVLTLRIKILSSVCRFCHSVLYIPSFTQLNWINFFLLLNINATFKKMGNQKVAGPQWLAYYYYYYLINTGLGQREWVNNDRNDILWWTIPLMTVSCIVLSL